MKLSSKNGWFYIIFHSLRKSWGFGITLDEESRLRKGYCNPSNSKQEFSILFYGDYNQITDLERHLKYEWKEYMSILYNEELEWIDDAKYPMITGKDIQLFCENRIFHYPYKDIYRIKTEHLPYKPSKYFVDIEENPEYFLELVNEPLTTSTY
jgi:hypothetical protein